MGRAIVRQPQAFLMDEPLSNLDAKLRVQMRAEIAKIQHDLDVTTVYVTHDQIEAMTMGDRVAVMSKGSLMQVDSPQNLYDHPDNLFVAAFIGSPQMNLLRGHYQAGAVVARSASAPTTSRCRRHRSVDRLQRSRHRRRDSSRAPLRGRSPSAANTITGKVTVREGLGSEVILYLEVDADGVDNAAVRDAMEGEHAGQASRPDCHRRHR